MCGGVIEKYNNSYTAHKTGTIAFVYCWFEERQLSPLLDWTESLLLMTQGHYPMHIHTHVAAGWPRFA